MAQFIRNSESVPEIPWIYHIVHIDRLQSILDDRCLLSDIAMAARPSVGTAIGMSEIKERRKHTFLVPDELTVGECVPFYFCPRSPMLYVISKANHPSLAYHGGQSAVVHLVFDPSRVATWAENNSRRFFVTDRTAACTHFGKSQELQAINYLDWNAIKSTTWQDVASEKAAEFLVEEKVPIDLLQTVGSQNDTCADQVRILLKHHGIGVPVRVISEWYY